jgi:hypothetical protein
MKYLIIGLLFFTNTLQAQTLGDYLWPTNDKPSIFFENLVEYVNMNCKEYERFPTQDIETMCQLQNVLDQRTKILDKISKSKLLLPPGKEWEALFLGVVTKDYDFSGNEITYSDVADFLVNQMALRKSVEATNRVFLVWHPSDYFSEVVYPAHLASLEGSSPFIYQLRYIKESQCNVKKTICVPFFNELNADLLGHLKLLGDAALKEVKVSSSWTGIESYLMTRATFRHFLKDINSELKNISVQEMLSKENENSRVIAIKNKLIAKLEDLNKFDLGLNENLVDAIFALAQLTEMDEILTELKIAPKQLDAEKLNNIEVTKYTDPLDAMIISIKTFVTGL